MSADPLALIAAKTTTATAVKDRMGYNPRFAGKRSAVYEAVARWIHTLEIPGVMAGDAIGVRVFEDDHHLVWGRSLFSGRVVIGQSNQSEPVVVGCVPDGSVVNITNSVPSQFSESVLRVSVYGVTEAIALDCAWRLWDLFNKRPGFERGVSFDCDNDGAPRTRKVDLTVQSLHPLDEPAVAERGQSRTHVSFRVFSRHSRAG